MLSSEWRPDVVYQKTMHVTMGLIFVGGSNEFKKLEALDQKNIQN